MRSLLSLVSRRGVRALLVSLAITGAVVAAVNLDSRSERQRAEAWATRHTATATLASLAAYPVTYRQALFNALPAAEQSRLWREQLQTVLDTETLTADQRAFLVRTMAQVTPASFEKGAPHPDVCDEMGRLFTNPKQKEKVRSIASIATPVRSLAASWVKVNEGFRSAVNLKADRYPCSCSGLGLCECALLNACINGDCETNMNCGCLWAGECDKMCMPQLPKMNRVTTGGN